MNADLNETKFLTKAQRQALALQKLQQQREEEANRAKAAALAHERFVTGKAELERQKQIEQRKLEEEQEKLRREKEDNKLSQELEHEIKTIRDHYLGGVDKRKKVLKPSQKFARLFKFDWDNDEDTMQNDHNPLYTVRSKINALFGRGYIAGVDLREQRKNSDFLSTLHGKRSLESQHQDPGEAQEASHAGKDYPMTESLGHSDLPPASSSSTSLEVSHKKRVRAERWDDLDGLHWTEKELSRMTERDWRIFREDFDIRIQGGRATLPLRYWSEAGLPEPIMRAIQDAGYEKPSPIQRQAIPVGLIRRDIIGIAETGSGKTVGIMYTLLVYICYSSVSYRRRFLFPCYVT